MICPQTLFTGGNERYQRTALCVTGCSQLMKAGKAVPKPAGGPGGGLHPGAGGKSFQPSPTLQWLLSIAFLKPESKTPHSPGALEYRATAPVPS